MFTVIEYLIPDKHTLKILCKSKRFPGIYKSKSEWVFFSEYSVATLLLLIF